MIEEAKSLIHCHFDATPIQYTDTMFINYADDRVRGNEVVWNIDTAYVLALDRRFYV